MRACECEKKAIGWWIIGGISALNPYFKGFFEHRNLTKR